MIKLSGLKVKNSNNIDGDIKIITTGLRPGEKLYEELLIDAKSQPTNHPLIFKGNESFLPYEELMSDLKELEKYINEQNKKLVFKILAKLVPEWTIDKSSEKNFKI